MPDKETLRRARRDKREGKAPSTQAGEFIREEIEHIREGKHGARSSKQAIAIGLQSAAAGVALPPPKGQPPPDRLPQLAKVRPSAASCLSKGAGAHASGRYPLANSCIVRNILGRPTISA
jgi:hypothetical protein